MYFSVREKKHLQKEKLRMMVLWFIKEENVTLMKLQPLVMGFGI